MDALHYFHKVREEGIISPDFIMFVCALKSCVIIESLDIGQEIHTEIIKTGLDMNPRVVCSLVDMYAKCGCLVDAQDVFNRSCFEDIVMWTALIGGYVEKGHSEKCLELLEELKKCGLSLDAVAYIYILKGCTQIEAIYKGQQIHVEVVKKGVEAHPLACNTIVDMYAKFGLLLEAQNIFEKQVPDLAISAWNSVMAGSTECGLCWDALDYFEQMQQCYGLLPDALTFFYALKAYKGIKFTYNVYAIHSMIITRGLDSELLVGNSLVSIYASFGFFTEAYGILNMISVRDKASWTTLIEGCVKHKNNREAITCFKEMQEDGVFPDVVTFACMVKTCSNLKNIIKGKKWHAEIVLKGLERDMLIGHMLVNLYTTCGSLVDAREVFDKLPVWDVVSWNTVIGGYADRGYGHEALNCFEHMESEGLSPDGVTFLCLLNACSHSGLLSEAEMYFDKMIKKYSMTPNLEHCTCMVIIFGCVGKFEKAMLVIKKKMPSLDYPAIWLALLSGCRKWGYVNLARLAFDWVVQLDNNCASAYVLMSNIYAAANMPEDVKKVESMIFKNRI